MIKKIYLDLDGVICDFDGRYKKMFGKFPSEVRNFKEFNPNWTDFVSSEQFKTLDLCTDAELLLHFIEQLNISGINIEILSSSRGYKFHEKVAEQKIYWLCRNRISYVANILNHRQLKSNYASPETILIDDTSDVIDAFNLAGGHGILHQNVNETIEKLKFIINNT